MSAVEVSACCCQTIGAPREVRQCPEHHTYFFSDKRLTSVSRVISTVMPSDYADVDPLVLLNAGSKGRFIDAYFCDWAMNHAVCSLEEFREAILPHFTRDRFKTEVEHAEDAYRRLNLLLDYWTRNGLQAKSTQHIFFSEKDGTAGAADVTTENLVLDLKCVSTLQPNYALQMGSYLHMDAQLMSFPIREAAIIHVQKERVRLVNYDGKKIKKQWQAALVWYQARQELTGI